MTRRDQWNTLPHRTLVAVVVLAAALLTAGCGDDSYTSKNDETKDQGSFRVAMVLPGPIDDMSWNATGHQALLLVERELGASVAYSENVAPEDMEAVFLTYAKEGFDLVIGHGGQTIAAAEQAAEAFPRTNFMIVGSYPGNNSNLGAVQFQQEEIGYLAGVVAGLATQSDKVAYVCGMPYTHMLDKGALFIEGAKSINPEVKAEVLTLDSWSDQKKGRRCGEALAKQGIDVIAVDADSAGLPIHALAESKGFSTIGWATDQHDIAPQTILTSAIQRTEIIILAGAELVRRGHWEGRLYKFGLRDGAQELAPFRGNLPEEHSQWVLAVEKRLREGKIDLVPPVTALEVRPCP